MVYCSGSRVKAVQEKIAEQLLSSLGRCWKTTENNMDAVTALSGSGPAYVFYLSQCLSEAGVKMGLPPSLAQGLARQTIFGAGLMLQQSQETAQDLRRRVTSPGGTTEAALHVLQNQGMQRLFIQALDRARRRARQLSQK